MIAFLCNIALLVAFAFAACGGNMRPPDTIPDSMLGDWGGHVAIVISPEIVRDYDAVMHVDGHGSLAHLEQICPDGTKSLPMMGFDGHLAFSGSVMCEQLSWVLGCGIKLEYTRATMEIGADGALIVKASGNAHRFVFSDPECVGSVPFTMEFIARTP